MHCSRSFKVNNFCTNQKPTCDFLLVTNTNLHPILHCFQIIADYQSNMHFRQGVPLFNTFIRGKTLNSRALNLVSRNQKQRYIIWCKMHFDILNHVGVADK